VRCVFFFRAEDGIRDFHVTGVQTCALPISNPNFSRKFEFSGFGAYGTRDGRFKYRASARAILSRRHWTEVGVTTQHDLQQVGLEDRKSTRLNSSHVKTSYAVCCLKKRTESP